MEIARLIDEAIKEGGKKVNWSGISLESVPVELMRLKNLEVLYLNNNLLTKVPRFLVDLDKLKVIHLSGNRLREFPNFLLEIPGLKKIAIDNNEIEDLHSLEILNSQIDQIDLNNNSISAINEGFAKSISGVRYLYLDNNRLDELPLTNTFEDLLLLSLENNRFTNIPEVIRFCNNLQYLRLSGNYIEELSFDFIDSLDLLSVKLSNNRIKRINNSLYSLKNLKDIDLSNNQIDSIDAGISNLSYLESIDLSSNNIITFPKDFFLLPELKNLRLRKNLIEELSDDIVLLSSLDVLDLEDNQLRTLPDSLMNLIIEENKVFRQFRIERNNFGAPPELFMNSVKQQIKYLSNLKKYGASPLNEAKMIVLGDPETGKTALIERLVDGVFRGSSEMTKGINITKWALEDLSINIWDFGGQEIMHAMHQFFMTERTIYLLLVSARRDGNNEVLEKWLELIKSYGGDSPVIVILSKSDVRNQTLDQNKLLDKYPRNIQGFVSTSALENLGIDDLKQIISSTLLKLDHARDVLPNNHFNLKKSIEESQKKKNYIDLHEYYSLCYESLIWSKSERLMLLKLFMDLGIVFNYGNSESPNETNILKPSWVTKGIYEIINSNLLFKKQGRASFADISKILNNLGGYEGKERVVVGLMIQFGLCVVDSRNEYLIPELLSEIQPPMKNEYQDGLKLYYIYKFLPSSIVPRVIANLYTLSESSTFIWRNGLIAKRDSVEALVKFDRSTKSLYISVIGDSNVRRDFLDEIRFRINDINRELRANVPEIYVPLHDQSEKSVKYSLLLQLERHQKEHIFVEDVGDVSVKRLLNGVVSEKERKSIAQLEGDVLLYKERITINLENKKEEFKPLMQSYKKLREKAESKAVTFKNIYILFFSVVVIAAIVIVVFSPWDSIEKWTYIVALVLSFISTIVFKDKIKPKEIESIAERYFLKKESKSEKFDIERYQVLKKDIELLEQKLLSL